MQQQVKKYPGLFEVIIEETFGITGGEEVHKDGPRGLNSGFTESYFVYYVRFQIPCYLIHPPRIIPKLSFFLVVSLHDNSIGHLA